MNTGTNRQKFESLKVNYSDTIGYIDNVYNVYEMIIITCI